MEFYWIFYFFRFVETHFYEIMVFKNGKFLKTVQRSNIKNEIYI